MVELTAWHSKGAGLSRKVIENVLLVPRASSGRGSIIYPSKGK
jgi:hypothetical protein